jgi:hypothetical protein
MIGIVLGGAWMLTRFAIVLFLARANSPIVAALAYTFSALDVMLTIHLVRQEAARSFPFAPSMRPSVMCGSCGGLSSDPIADKWVVLDNDWRCEPCRTIDL